MTAKSRRSRSRPDYKWEDLVLPLRRYRATAVPIIGEEDFKNRVNRVLGLFADQATPLADWLRKAMPVLQETVPLTSSGVTRRQAGAIHTLLPDLLGGRVRVPTPGARRCAAGHAYPPYFPT